ncbi:MAG: serine--tRNA ligase [Chlamydiia bacterium]|nr:serine--tRNA ligase [Chlamydiia bacterium]
MIDIHLIRNQTKEVEKRLQTKDPTISLSPIVQMDNEARSLKTQVEELKSERNSVSKCIGEKKRLGEDTATLMASVATLGDSITALDQQLTTLSEKLQSALSQLPNLPDASVSISADPKDNVFVRAWGEKPTFSFAPKHHLELGEKHKLFDFEKAAKITGSGWPLYRGNGARLEWALLNFMLDFHIKNGYEMILPPLVARPDIMYGSGQLPKFADQLYKLEDDFYLNPTSEVVLNGLNYDSIIDAKDLPQKYAAYTPCFRREAGAAGSGERGLIRMHQFNKVEMFCFCHPDESDNLFDEMIDNAENLLKALNLHYRVMNLVTGDLSFGAARCYDIEVWLPGQNRYYEVSSVSNCRDFQARRSKTRAKAGSDKPFLVHTLNGSGLATSRLLVAILENNQQSDGTIPLPTALHPYMGDLTLLK